MLNTKTGMKPFHFPFISSMATVVTLLLDAYYIHHIHGFTLAGAPITTSSCLHPCTTFIVNRNQTHRLARLNDNEERNADELTKSDSSFSFIDSSEVTLASPIYYPEEEGEDEEVNDCLPPGRALRTQMVMLISDSTGQTVKAAFGKSLAQFEMCDNPNLYLNSPGYSSDVDDDSNIIGNCNVQVRVFTFIRSEAALASITKKAAEKKAFVLFTFANSPLKLKAERMCELSSVPFVDLLGPTLSALSNLLGKNPVGLPGPSSNISGTGRSGVKLSDSYYRRIAGVEFTLKADDGQAPWLLPEAEVVLVGVSRTGKTPLSVVLSQTTGLKVANVPLVVECPLPEQLKELDPNRVFCLTIAPSELRRIRTARLERQFETLTPKESSSSSKTKSMEQSSNYADRAYLLNDLKNARGLADKYGWTEIDVTGRAVEETSSYIMEIMNLRFGQGISSL